MKVIYSGLLCSQYGEGLCDPLVVDSHLVHQLFSLDGVELLEDRCFIEYDWDVGMLGSILCDCVEVNVFMDVVKAGTGMFGWAGMVVDAVDGQKGFRFRIGVSWSLLKLF